MPDKLTDNEIKKAFECCFLDKPCEECPLCEIKHADKLCFNGNVKQIPRMVLDLINRQQAEIERLKELLEEWKTQAYKVADEKDRLLDTIRDLKIKCGLAEFRKYKADFEEFKAEIKAEAYKEFAEKLKKDVFNTEYNIDGFYRRTIDKTLIEMKGENVE